MDNNFLVENINQILHNEGIEFNNRLEIIIKIINKKFNNLLLEDDDKISKKIFEILNKKDIILTKNEIFQQVFMFYGNKKSKINLDQYYTPITIGDFIMNLCIPNKSIIDPACGLGDLIINYNGSDIHLWDISQEVLDICENNFRLNQKEFNIKCVNSIKENDKDNGKFDYCCLNPPFGISTIVNETSILKNYDLGLGKKKEEIGIIFVERALKLLKDDGILFLIIPNGYLGNSTKNILELRKYLLSYRIIAIIELPQNTFLRSGTGVSTSLLIIQKTKIEIDYNIYIKKINNIGYYLNKKSTPYKYKNINGNIKLDNDFDDCLIELKKFIKDEMISNMLNNDIKCEYEFINTSKLDRNILDINRYLNVYLKLMNNIKIDENYHPIINYIQEKYKGTFKKINDKEYLYLDIKQITSPIYSKTNLLFGSELPTRAKIHLKKFDIIVSKLKGKINFTIILDDYDNIIASNGFTLLRPNNYKNALILFANLFTEDFKIQHNSLATGSIMETINDDDIKNIHINNNIDLNKYKTIIDALMIINKEL